MPTHLCFIRKTALDFPEKMAILYESKKISYEQLDGWISNFQLLLKRHSFKKIAIIPIKPLDTLVILFACLRESIDLCFLNARHPYKENKKQAKYVKADLLIDFKKNQFPLFFQEDEKKTEALIDGEKTSILVSTSGSSGHPKIAVLTFDNFFYSSLSACKILGFSSEDGWLLSLPLFHVAGLCIVFRAIIAGGYIEIKSDDLFSCSSNFMSLVPTQLVRILQNPKLSEHLAKRLKGLLLGGSLISPTLLKKAKQFPVFISYGLTEMASHVLLSKPIVRKHQIYLGFSHSHTQIKLKADGEILVKGKTLFKGYLQENQTVYLPIDRKGFFYTKDLGVFSKKEGFGFYARKDLMFISGGENIYPEEIEKALLLLKGVDMAFVIPVKDKEFGMRPVAFLKTQKSFSKIQKDLSKTLPKYKIPVYFYSLNPLLEISMKVDRNKLKKILKNSNFCL